VALAERMRVQMQSPKRAFKLVPKVDPAEEWMIKRVRMQVVPTR
jgi:hypothetical protein